MTHSLSLWYPFAEQPKRHIMTWSLLSFSTILVDSHFGMLKTGDMRNVNTFIQWNKNKSNNKVKNINWFYGTIPLRHCLILISNGYKPIVDLFWGTWLKWPLMNHCRKENSRLDKNQERDTGKNWLCIRQKYKQLVNISRYVWLSFGQLQP